MPRYPGFSVSTSINGDATLSLRGELDMATEQQLLSSLEAAVTAGAARVVFDLRELSFIDVAGVRALQAGQRRCAEEGRELYLAHCPDTVQRVFSLCGVEHEFERASAVPSTR
jgi:anti-sigma B factor antagonist